MIDIRQATPSDLDALYQISIETGHAGGDARQHYSDHKLIGHIYSAPYVIFEPELAFVATRHDQVVGYCAGTSNTTRFEAKLEKEWWPSLRRKFPKPDEDSRSNWSEDQKRCQMIHTPKPTPKEITDGYPAHIHMNLLPTIQGQGVGAKLLNRWITRAIKTGVPAAHIGANASNKRAIGFWRSQDFDELPRTDQRTVWMGRQLP